jgi:hypothetical protein
MEDAVSLFEKHAAELIRSYLRYYERAGGSKEELIRALYAMVSHSRKNRCLNCKHSRADLRKIKESEVLSLFNRVCVFGLRNTECCPAQGESPGNEQLFSEFKKLAKGLIDSYLRLVRGRGIDEDALVKALYVMTQHSSKNPCLNCLNSRANIRKARRSLEEAGTISVFDRVCALGLKSTECTGTRDPLTGKLINMRREIIRGKLTPEELVNVCQEIIKVKRVQ